MPSALTRPSLSRPVPAGLRRWLPAPPFLIAALVLATAFLVDWESVWPDRDRSVEIDSLAQCSTGRPQVTVPVLDVSGSVIDSGGADPHGRSFDEARALARALSEAPCTRDDRFGAVIFASDAVEIPPTLVSSQSIIERNLVRPPKDEIGGGTDLVRALDLTDQVARRYPGTDVIIIVLSDMDVPNSSELDARLATMGASQMHLVALGRHDPRYDSRFESVTELADVGRGAVAEALADAVSFSRLDAASVDGGTGGAP